MKERSLGIILSTLVGVIALFSAPYIPMINSIVLALFIGMVITNLTSLNPKLNSGIHFSGKTLLEIAIIFLGFGISFHDITSVGLIRVIILVVTVLMVLTFTYFISEKLYDKPATGYLIGFGTAICGSSAIAALAPKINASKSDIGISIAVINLMGLIGMLAIPLVFSQTMDSDTAALIIGGTLHGVSNVAGAGYAMNETIGDLSLTIKLARVALLAPALIFFNMLLSKNFSIKENLKLPYYIVGFIAASTLVSLVSLPSEVISIFRFSGTFLLTVSMAAIGLNIKFKHLMLEGKSAIKYGLIVFVIQLLIVGLLSVFV